MRVAIFDGTGAGDEAAAAASAALARVIENRGWDAQKLVLRGMHIPHCLGCFECWVRTPGLCIAKGDCDTVARAAIGGDLVVLLTRVTFGGYGSHLKKGLDHCIPLISPFFKAIDGETHHKKRYGRYPALVAIGLQARADEEPRRIFETLVARNAVNMHAPWHRAIVVAGPPDDQALGAQIAECFDSSHPDRPELAAGRQAEGGREITRRVEGRTASPPSSVLLLVGSPKKGMSTSEVLGDHLLDRLAVHGARQRSLRLHRVLGSDASCEQMRTLVGDADLIVLATPLYVDSLPSHVISVLEMLSACRQSHPPVDATRVQRFACLLNCGFPEAAHNDTAIRICRQFAREAGFDWAGGLALGAGERISGRPLTKMGGAVRHVASALDLAGDALAGGKPIPDEAVELMAKPLMPSAVYRIASDVGWRMRAREFGAQWRLHAQPYADAYSVDRRP